MVDKGVSVIIPTFNGETKITGVLSALENQNYTDFETIVVVDGSADSTVLTINSRKWRLKALRVMVRKENRGRAATRNQGLEFSTGAIVIFYDDDMLPEPDSVEKHVLFHSKHDAIVCGCPVELPEASKTDIQNFKSMLVSRWLAKYGPGLNRLDETNLFFSAANCSFPRSIIENIEGFNATLKDGEDLEIAYRCLLKGINVYFDNSNRAVHVDPITCRSYIKRLREYGRARQDMRTTLPALPSRKTNTIKRLIYRIFGNAAFVKMIDNHSFVFWMPRHIRYKFYELTIHALGVEYPLKKI